MAGTSEVGFGRRIRGVGVVLAAAGILLVPQARATLRYGDIQISGNVSAQQLVRIQSGSETFSAFDLVQQRNTFRLQYEHQLVKEGGKFLDGIATLPLIRSANLFTYYRLAYDSIFDIAPGGFLETQSGEIAGKISDIRRGDRRDVAWENNIREIFLDLELKGLPVSFRIGRQQIVWGEALSFRAIDSVNALDLSWHLQQEAGLLGKVGFDELRIPAWSFKALWDVGSVGPFSNVFVEAFDTPFDFQPAYARFEPAPWSAPIRNPLRGGLAVDLGTAALGTPTGILVQPCFDLTGGARDPNNGEILNNSDAGAAGHPIDFSDTAVTGFCPSSDLQVSKIGRGLYDRRDPKDVNQFGGRVGFNVAGFGITLNYLNRRQLGADIPVAGVLKTGIGAITNDAAGFIEIDPHDTTDPITRQTFNASPLPLTPGMTGFLRVPAQFYYPYVHVFGASANYFEEFTSAVYTVEATFTPSLPIATLNPFGNGIKRKDVILGAVNFDRPTWIKFLNPRATWLIIGQLNFNYVLNHEDIRQIGTSATGQPQFDGDVGNPSQDLIPELVDGGAPRLDRVKSFETLSLFAFTSFYWGGSLAPLLAWISDWANAPSMGFVAAVDYLPTPNLIVTPGIAIFTNFGRIVDEPWGIGRLSQWDELRLRFTYQF